MVNALRRLGAFWGDEYQGTMVYGPGWCELAVLRGGKTVASILLARTERDYIGHAFQDAARIRPLTYFRWALVEGRLSANRRV